MFLCVSVCPHFVSSHIRIL